MAPQMGVRIGHARVVEVAGRIVPHAKALHDGGGTMVVPDGEGDDFIVADDVERLREPGLGGLGPR